MSNQSGTARGRSFKVHEENSSPEKVALSVLDLPPGGWKHTMISNDSAIPLISNKLGNNQVHSENHAASAPKVCRQLLESTQLNQMIQKLKVDTSIPKAHVDNDQAPVDALLAKLSARQAALVKAKQGLASPDAITAPSDSDTTQSTVCAYPLTPATESFDIAPGIAGKGQDKAQENAKDKPFQMDAATLFRLTKELDEAKTMIARQEKELTETRSQKKALEAKTDFDKAKAAVTACSGTGVLEEKASTMQPSHLSSTASSPKNFKSEHYQPVVPSFGHGQMPPPAAPLMGLNSFGMANPSNIWGNRSWNGRPGGPNLSPLMIPAPGQATTNYSGAISPISTNSTSFGGDFGQFSMPNAFGRHFNGNVRGGNGYGLNRGGFWDRYGSSAEQSPIGPMANGFQPMSLMPFGGPMQFQRPMPNALSPTSSEFTPISSTGPWSSGAPASPGLTYIPPNEPLNYRRLLDRSVTCDWKYIVDKIVCNNDQQASIFLQQKLKVGTVEQKFDIVEAIIAQAYALMINRFGNFLVQRCFEHGTPQQVISIANAIRGHTVTLSMDAFGCHVVQKAFDAVPEEYKAIMVHELLRRIPETVIHRYACHVWQKLFELRWSDSPPQIMKYVNEALRGMWHEVALGETGSLVVQNIFENCLEEDKRPCINEVLDSIDIVAHGQFGNWCIQHICEHGAPADRSCAIDHVIRYATEYSMDQFASKVVEKCLKIGGSEFLERYLDRICEGRPDRPRIPLIDISSDQYGNYLIQYILTHANASHREIVGSHIRKHMVSLRGSKFGSRVGMLCCNPAYATRPGPPPLGPAAPRFNNATNNTNNNTGNGRFGGAFR